MSYTSAFAAPFRAIRKTSLLQAIHRAHILRKERKQLASLDDKALADIGITRADVAHELAKSAWDVPSERPCKCW